ncbi:MAG: hypothetical protein WBH71_04065 [Bacteroidales bacterium]|jgi:hypothetical protein|nr:hypothetical protein [Bacteroidota bacterium]OQC37203.1 MAG: hypothetical protein BWX63_01240 [Bacteroidetes bacterium ADurb.Bin041]HNV51067.1 hypothetical protein [Bacteroidales bacterium]HOF81871.1 hypothetical protein [Bacteroidales bacterium]HQB47312.1 hypothetical protein [Bacteroidales bacterium]
MKEQVKFGVIYQVMVIGVVCIMLSSCSTYNKIYSDDDIVYSTKRFELKYYCKDRDRRTPIYFFTQSIVKEVDQNNNVSYRAYDVLFLISSSFKLDEKVILIIDNKPYPMVIDKIELENVKTISENTTDIQTSDSTTVSVTTGYSENNKKITRFSYKIPVSTIMEIKKANQISFRYYSGPSMITVKPKKLSIKKIKELIDIE